MWPVTEIQINVETVIENQINSWTVTEIPNKPRE
jgi:hypothetical protein